ncbi:hypothetical protein CDL15_Pgr000044 [Punica granatum]|jgi:hypothetical protein|uniref:Reverse transcriptase domain-containing protein n=1 Tax=Punica granatum TaxID=22663 RepID=A0A218VQF6_PUNGR|nr:hypothetical protein CDL15_Pgr000044 [Punica granatum]PKI40643.1 hypothetical protein CRG98_038958 [Punica granatum]
MKKFVVVYLDDIVVYSQTLKEHLPHLRTVFERLRGNEFYVKEEKFSFAQHEILFLGHWIRVGTIRMDKDKVRAITECQAPTKVKELQSFFGLANYYPRFLRGYSKKSSSAYRSVEKGPQVAQV